MRLPGSFFLTVLLTRSVVQAQAPPPPPQLGIAQATLHQSAGGLPIETDFRFQPGDTVYFTCQIDHYAKKQKDQQADVFFSYEIAVRDPKGVLIVPIEKEKVETTVTAEDKNWHPILRADFVVPPTAATGTYEITIDVTDQIGGGEGHATVHLPIQGKDVAPSDTLAVRNFDFLRNENDRKAVQVAAYGPGDTLWARFDMTGYKFGDNNAYDVAYGFRILGAKGEKTFEVPQAAGEQHDSFYPQTYTAGGLSVAIPKDIRRGAYTLVLVVRDNIGKQTCELSRPFSVE